MRVVIIGARGQLGLELARVLRDTETTRLAHDDVEITDVASVRAAMRPLEPEVVFNAAAFNRVDDAELDPRQAVAVNILGARNVALVCQELGAALVHFSTDYVFSGDARTPYGEGDLPAPVNIYGISKLAGELAVRATVPRHYVIRTCGLYGRWRSGGKGGNFVETMLGLQQQGRQIRVVDDQVCAPTACTDLAVKTRQLVGTAPFGLYHVTAAGQCSWFTFAEAIFETAGLVADLAPQNTSEAGRAARRPAFSVLRHDRLRDLGLDEMSHWRDGLRRYLEERVSEPPATG